MSCRRTRLAVAVAALCGSPTVATSATFTALGPTTPGAVALRPRGVSGDGGYAVGAGGTEPFRWSADTGAVALSSLGGPANGLARAISADGATVVGFDFAADQAYRWSESGGLVLLPDYGLGGIEGAFGVSADGQVIVGSSGGAGVTWQDEFASPLPLFPGGNQAMGFNVSADGRVVVGKAEVALDGGEGFSYRYDVAARWASGPPEALGILPGGLRSEARAASADGTVIVGFSDTLFTVDGGEGFGVSTDEAFRWTAATGMVGLGRSPGPLPAGSAGRSWALDVSADGNVIVGFASFGGSLDPGGGAAVWIGSSGPLQVFDLLVAQGATGLEGWTLDSVEAISADGSTLAGDGLFCSVNGCQAQGWIATINPTVVPAPSAVWLLGSGIAALAVRRRRR